MLPLGVLFLSAFVNNSLFVQVDSNVRDTFICVSVNNEKNDTWPSRWKHSKPLGFNLFKYDIDERLIQNSTSIQYKLRMYYLNRTLVESPGWQQLYQKPIECNSDVGIYFIVILFIVFIIMTFYILYKLYLKYK